MQSLLTDEKLEASEVVANCLMNRQRQLMGTNSYTKELGFNPLDFLTNRIKHHQKAAWLDICCGTGRALIQAADFLYQSKLSDQALIIGVDIVDQFYPHPPELTCLKLIVDSVQKFSTSQRFIAILNKKIQEWSQKQRDGKYRPYCQIVIYYLKKKVARGK